MPHGLSDYLLVRILASLAQSLGQKVVAEGVEDPSAIEILRHLGVDYAQGKLIGQPQPVEQGQPREPEPKARESLAAALSY